MGHDFVQAILDQCVDCAARAECAYHLPPTVADGDIWRIELEERRLLKKGFHPGNVRLPRGIVSQCIICESQCDTAWPIEGYYSAFAELRATPLEGNWHRIRREQEAIGNRDDVVHRSTCLDDALSRQ